MSQSRGFEGGQRITISTITNNNITIETIINNNMRDDTAVKSPPILTPLINMSQSRGFEEGGQRITIIANDDEDENYERIITMI